MICRAAERITEAMAAVNRLQRRSDTASSEQEAAHYFQAAEKMRNKLFKALNILNDIVESTKKY